MKKLLFIFLFIPFLSCAGGGYSFAQIEDERNPEVTLTGDHPTGVTIVEETRTSEGSSSPFKPVQDDIGVTFGIRSVSAPLLGSPGNTGTIVFKYLITDRLAARAALAFSTNGGGTSGTTESDTTGIGVLITTTTKSSSWAINFGLQQSFSGTEKLDPYIGADVFFGGTNGSIDTKTEIVSESGVGSALLTDTLSTAIVGDYDQTKVNMVGNASNIGVNVFAGFNYFFAQKFAIGAEFAWGITSVSTKNGATTKIVKRDKIKNQTTTPNSATTKSGGFGTAGSGMISVSWFF